MLRGSDVTRVCLHLRRERYPRAAPEGEHRTLAVLGVTHEYATCGGNLYAVAATTT